MYSIYVCMCSFLHRVKWLITFPSVLLHHNNREMNKLETRYKLCPHEFTQLMYITCLTLDT